MSEQHIEVTPTDLDRTLTHVRSDGYSYLSFITAVDERDRFRLFYRVVDPTTGDAMTIEIEIPRDDPRIPSAYPHFRGADWQEREIYDLFGIEFDGHPDLRRIVLAEDFSGHPLRKDWDAPDFERRPEYC